MPEEEISAEIKSTVNPEEKIIYSKVGPSHFLDSSLASIEFQYQRDGKWFIFWVESKGAGGAKRIVRELYNHLGKGQKVTSPIIEPETLKKLNELGFKGKEKITSSEILRQLKMVRVFEGGGFETEAVSLRTDNDPDTNQPKLSATYFGHT